MDHSLRGYLERRSTKELYVILHYVSSSDSPIAEDAKKMVLAILEERERGTEQVSEEAVNDEYIVHGI
ncbi:MAG: hypothetical protein IJW41_02065 [Oscillospiraceae bacterium]|nr:hypothetical protein [Oscillospiraceae bacterium]